MDVFVIGIIKDGARTVGFRVMQLDIAKKYKQIGDYTYSQVYRVLKSQDGQCFKNIKADRGRIVGVNGKLDRYGELTTDKHVKKNIMVILKDVVDTHGKHTGYLIANVNGDFRVAPEDQVVAVAEKFGIANGKVMPGKNGGKPYISPIEGTYEQYVYESQKQGVQQPAQQAVQKPVQPVKQAQPVKSQVQQPVTKPVAPVAQPATPVAQPAAPVAQDRAPDNFERAEKLIKELQKFRCYDGSFQNEVADTVLRYHKCSDKQLDIFEKAYKEWKDDGKPLKYGETLTIDYMDNSDESCFNYVRMDNNKIYIKGFKKDKEAVNVVIPDTVDINGKVHKVEGIAIRAFAGQVMIKSVKTGKYISDIGQRAFERCSGLESLDLSQSINKMVPAYMCCDCVSLTDVALASELERIHEFAFGNCKQLKTLTGADRVDTIARCAFMDCTELKALNSKTKVIGEKAFLDCYNLESFNFDEVQSIGSHAFRYTGFKELKLSGSIREIGDKAFADCALLEKVDIGDGVEVVKQFAFAKSEKSCEDVSRYYRKSGINPIFADLAEIRTTRSIKDLGADAFRHVQMVYGYTGSPVEAHCIGFNIPFRALDIMNNDNSSKIRIMTASISGNSANLIYRSLMGKSAGKSNPPSYQLKTDKLVNMDFTAQLKVFGLEPTTEQKEPHIKFKAAVNYLQDTTDLYKDPLTRPVLRLQDAMYITSTPIYDDGCNRIYKATFTIMDTLEEGAFIIVLMDNKLVYIADVNVATNIEMTTNNYDDVTLDLKRYLHVGDKIGTASVVSGANCIIADPKDGHKINVGDMLYNMIMDNAIVIKPSKGERWLYVPCAQTSLKVFDYKKDENTENSKIDSYSVVAMEDYDNFLKEVKKLKKSTLDNTKFFNQLKSMTDSEVKRKVTSINIVEEEKEAQLFKVSKAFNDLLDKNNTTVENMDTSIVTKGIFNELSRSYWMVSKDSTWLRQNGTKSLNKTAEYKIEDCLLIEYKSNQIVKFSNPYMNGCKGAYVFVLKKGSQTLGVYASRYEYKTLLAMLHTLTYIPSSARSTDGYPELMKDANTFDVVEPSLFSKFYDVMYSKGDWHLSSYMYSSYTQFSLAYASFGIYMYKPTGIFYLAMETYALRKTYGYGKKSKDDEDRKYARSIIPILPIGNMDRALIVATTTNNNARKSRLFNELLVLSLYVIAQNANLRMPAINHKELEDFDASVYCKARQLVIDGEKSTEPYKKLISDRAVYMLGTVHKGVLKREFSSNDEDAEDVSDYLDDIDVEEEEVDEEDYMDDDDLEDVLDDVLNELDDEDDYYDEDYDDSDEEDDDDSDDDSGTDDNSDDADISMNSSSLDEDTVEYMEDDLF